MAVLSWKLKAPLFVASAAANLSWIMIYGSIFKEASMNDAIGRINQSEYTIPL